MTNNQTSTLKRANNQYKNSSMYTAEELAKNIDWYEESTPQPIESKTIIKTKVIDITPHYVVLDTGFKFDGIVSLTEFKDLPDLKKGSIVEVYVESSESKKNEIVLSRKKLEVIKGWKIIKESFASQEPIQITIIRKSPGGLIGSIHGIEVFLPGSQIDLRPVKDHDAFVNTKVEVLVINVNEKKKNVIVSRKTILKNSLETQKKAIVDSLEEGQILEGVVKNIESYGAFIDLGGLTGLVYIGDMVWNKRINDPSEAKDEQGNRIFEKGKKVKAVVISLDKEKGHVSLATKPLLPNHWETLIEEVEKGSIIPCKVARIMENAVILEVKYGIEAIMYSADMSLSAFPPSPKDLVTVGQELEAMIMHIDSGKKSLRLGTKQLMEDPWKKKNFSIDFGLNSIHEAKVIRFSEDRVHLEIQPGITGFLYNRHLSWTKKINNASKVLTKGENYKVIVIGIDETKKILELGYRELEETPWDKFQKTFVPGSIHKGTITLIIPQGAIVQLAEGPESFVSNKDLTKISKDDLKAGKEIDFIITDFIKHEEKIRISHDAISDPTKKKAFVKRSEKPINFITTEKTTLGDIALVSDTKKTSPAIKEQQKAKEQKEEKNKEEKE